MTEAVCGLYMGVISAFPLITSVVPLCEVNGAPPEVGSRFFFIMTEMSDILMTG